MGRPPKGPDPTVSVTARLSSKLVAEIDDLSKAIRANNRTAILQEIVEYGLEVWKKKNPHALELLKDYKRREAIGKAILKESKM
ncbi:MAG: hypothetical protein F9K48_01590 [Candidatus Brocadia sp.]|nr:MAG: hypothetical protein F9K48_01590 [Candidatus Brocadia sp.]